MSDDVRTANVVAKAERIVEQYKAWQQWQTSLHKNPDDWQAFRRDLLAVDPDEADEPDGPFIRGVGTGKTAFALTFFESAFETARSQWQAGFHIPGDARPGSDETPASQPNLRWFIPFNPLGSARVRGEQMKRDILATQGELLDAEQVAGHLGIQLSEVARRIQEGSLVGLSREDGTPGFPAWQFTDTGLLPGLQEVLRDLGVRSVWMRAAFFLSGDLRLGGQTPLEALLLGEVDAVRGAAAAYGEQLAS